MQSDAELTLKNLYVLAALSHNDKLMTNQDGFDIYVPTPLRGAMRMWYGENRLQNVQRIHATVRTAMALLSSTIEHAGGDVASPRTASASSASSSSAMAAACPPPVDARELRVRTAALQHRRLRDALRDAVGGLGNLLQTYRDDASVVSQLTLVVGEMRDFLRVVQPLDPSAEAATAAAHERHAGPSPSSHSPPSRSPPETPVPSAGRRVSWDGVAAD